MLGSSVETPGSWFREGLVLSLDSSLGPGSVALARGGAICGVRRAEGEGKGKLATLVDELLREVGVTIAEVDAFVVGVGPGRFTGVRSAVAVAKGLAFATEKPLVAAVEGHAVGIGTTMLLHCDLSYAAPSAKFRMPFVDLALVPEGCSSLLLPRMLGMARASELLLLAEGFSGTEAAAYGVVSRTAPEGEVLEFARAKARALAAKAPEAVRQSKRLLRERDRALVDAVMVEEAAVFLARLRSPELQEAVTAFMEKRSPDFSTFR
jgi:tRNA threonylcarbamoyl adenosine modification protein YeaZ